MASAANTLSASALADDAVAFRHLLHEVASHVTGLGLTLEMLGEPEITVEDTSAMVLTARGALDDLRYLIGDIGELRRFLNKHGDARPERVAASDLIADLEKSGVHADPQASSLALGLPPVQADRAVIGFILNLLAKSCRRTPGVHVTALAMAIGERFIRIELCATYDETKGARRALEKAPMVVDHFCNAIARDLGGRFVREQSRSGQRVGFVLPVFYENR